MSADLKAAAKNAQKRLEQWRSQSQRTDLLTLILSFEALQTAAEAHECGAFEFATVIAELHSVKGERDAAQRGCASLRSELEAARVQAAEDDEVIDGLGQVVCGVAFTNGQYEEHNATVRSRSECAFCGKVDERTPDAMRRHLETCHAHPAFALRARVAMLREALVRAASWGLASPGVAVSEEIYAEHRADVATVRDALAATADSEKWLTKRIADDRAELLFHVVLLIRGEKDPLYVLLGNELTQRDARVRGVAP